MDSKVNNLISECRTYLNVPWRHQGRSRRGVDCVGFLLLALKSIGVDMLEIKGYSRHPDGVELKKVMDNQPNMRMLQPSDKIRVGDIVLFRIRREPQHVALIVPSNTADFGMIHSYNGGERKVIEHDFADYWKHKVVSIYRLK